jgi:hypothetical protein
MFKLKNKSRAVLSIPLGPENNRGMLYLQPLQTSDPLDDVMWNDGIAHMVRKDVVTVAERSEESVAPAAAVTADVVLDTHDDIEVDEP